MVTVKNSIKIRTTSDEIFRWLKNLDKHYKEWHPDHVKWINETGNLDKGNTAYYEEYLHRELHKSKAKIVNVEENKKIEFANLFPMGIICPKGSFIIERRGTIVFSPLRFLSDLAGSSQDLQKTESKL